MAKSSIHLEFNGLISFVHKRLIHNMQVPHFDVLIFLKTFEPLFNKSVL